MHRAAFLTASLLGILIALTGCQTMDTKTGQGQAIGAMIGGVLGATAGDSKTDKLLYGTLGAVIGGVIGNQIGKYLDQQDKAAIERATVQSLQSSGDGQTQRYDNPESGVVATITPSDTRKEQKTVRVVHDRTVEPPPSLELIGETYIAKSGARVRPSPDTTRDAVDFLPKGSKIDVIGKVSGRDWYMLARNGKSIGYTYAPLLKPSPSSSDEKALTTPEKEQEQIDLQLQQGSLMVASVDSTTECRTVNYTIDAVKKGQQEQSSFEACKAADGAWVLDA